MRRAAFVLWAAVALSRAVSGQTSLLSPGVAAKGHIDPQTGAVFSFYANPGDAVLIRLLTLSQDYSLQFTLRWNFGYPTTETPPPITRRPLYSVPSYITMDLRLAWRPRKHLELAVMGQNLLQPYHYEFGSSTDSLGNEVTEVPRGVYGTASWRY